MQCRATPAGLQGPAPEVPSSPPPSTMESQPTPPQLQRQRHRPPPPPRSSPPPLSPPPTRGTSPRSPTKHYRPAGPPSPLPSSSSSATQPGLHPGAALLPGHHDLPHQLPLLDHSGSCQAPTRSPGGHHGLPHQPATLDHPGSPHPPRLRHSPTTAFPTLATTAFLRPSPYRTPVTLDRSPLEVIPAGGAPEVLAGTECP